MAALKGSISGTGSGNNGTNSWLGPTEYGTELVANIGNAFHHSTDEGVTWSQSSTFTATCPIQLTLGGFATAFGKPGSTNIGIAYASNNAASANTVETGPAQGGAPEVSYTIWGGTNASMRSNGELVALFNSTTSSVMGTAYGQVGYTRRTAANTWTTPVTVSQGGSVSYGPVQTATDGSRVMFFWAQDGFSTGVMYASTLSASNALSATTTLGTPAILGSGGRTFVMSNAVTVGTTGYLAYMETSGGVLQMLSWTWADSPTITTTAVTGGANVSSDTIPLLLVDPATSDLYLVYLKKVSPFGNYYQKLPSGSSTWGAETSLGVNVGSFRGGHIYQNSSNATILGFFSAQNYYEHTLAAGAETHSGSLGVSGAGTLTVPTLQPKPTQTQGLSGAGTLTLAGKPGVVGTATLSGTGTLTGASPQVSSGSVTLAGAGTLTGSAAALLLPPANLTATPVSPTQINLAWDAATGATGYDIERDGVIISSGQVGTTYSDTGLTQGTSYTYRVRAEKVES